MLILPGVLLSPVAVFYGAGYILSFSYFFATWPALICADELALMGFARLAGQFAVFTFLGFFGVLGSFYLGTTRTLTMISPRRGNTAAAVTYLVTAVSVGLAS